MSDYIRYFETFITVLLCVPTYRTPVQEDKSITDRHSSVFMTQVRNNKV